LPFCAIVFGLVALACALVLAGRPTHAAVPPQYYKVDRIVLPVIRRQGLEGHLFLVIYLEMNDTKYRPLIDSKMTPLRDEYIRSLNRYIARHPRILYKVPLKDLKALLLRATERVVGEGKVKAILIQAAANRRF
jgi:hypothetical protein